jgi:hypothetical protein
MPLSFKYEIINNPELEKELENNSEYENYCLYYSFYLNLNKVLPDSKKIPLNEFLNLFGKKDLYSYFTDFLINFPKIKDFLKDRIQLFKLRKLFNNWKIGIFLKKDNEICTELSVLEFKYLNFPQIKRHKYDSIKKSMMNKFNYKDPYLVCFLQDNNHFEPIILTEKLGDLEHSEDIKKFLDEKITSIKLFHEKKQEEKLKCDEKNEDKDI